MANVTFERNEYQEALPSWELVSDVLGGERKVKARGDTYLPRPNPDDKSATNKTRYSQYLARAVFYNATGRTMTGLLGAAYKRPPEVEIPSSMDYLMDDADGQGIGLIQQSQNTLACVLGKGRHGLWVDFPKVEGAASRADLTSQQVRANILAYDAMDIVNWRLEKRGASMVLVMVVLKEGYYEVTDDGFGLETKTQYRVLRLVDNTYTVEIWRERGDGWTLADGPVIPTNGSGGAWDVIPFTFVGSEDNSAAVNMAPMQDLAHINIAHYRNSADYEDSAYFVGQAQPWISGLDEQWRNHLEEGGIYVGSRTPIPLPEGGQFGIAQASPNTMVKEAMDQKEDQMIALGARLVQKGQAVKTATEAQSEAETEHSVLSLAAENVGAAYETALEWAGEFMNVSGEYSFQLNREYVEHRLDSQQILALVGAWQAGTLPRSELFSLFRNGGLIDPEKTDEEILEEIEVDPAGLGLDDGTTPDNS